MCLLLFGCAGFLAAQVLARSSDDACAADGMTQAVAQQAFGSSASVQLASDSAAPGIGNTGGGSLSYCQVDVAKGEAVTIRVYPVAQASSVTGAYELGGAKVTPLPTLGRGAVYVSNYGAGQHVLDEDVIVAPAGASVTVVNGLAGSTPAGLSGLETIAAAVATAVATASGPTTTSPAVTTGTSTTTTTSSEQTTTTTTTTGSTVASATGRVSALSATSITAGGLTCVLPPSIPTAGELSVGNSVRMTCAGGQLALLTFTSLPPGPWFVVARKSQVTGRVAVVGARIDTPILFGVKVTAEPATSTQINVQTTCLETGEQMSRMQTLPMQGTPIVDVIRSSNPPPPYCYLEVSASKSAAAAMTVTLFAQKQQ